MSTSENGKHIKLDPPASRIVHTRAYQEELLKESMHRNIVIALDTGSGKTHIAVLRIKHEVEHESRKVRLLMHTFSLLWISHRTSPSRRSRGS